MSKPYLPALNKCFILISFYFFFQISTSLANCEKEYAVKIEQASAEAGLTSNFFGSRNSLSNVVSKVVKNGKSKLSNFKSSGCSTNCEGLSAKPRLKLKVSPAKYLSSYSSKELCESLKKKTSISKLKYSSPNFSSQSEFSDWFSDFARGKGAEGKKLYKECPGDCSPSYEVYIIESENGFQAKTEVICQNARDKSDGKYAVQSEAIWSCTK